VSVKRVYRIWRREGAPAFCRRCGPSWTDLAALEVALKVERLSRHTDAEIRDTRTRDPPWCASLTMARTRPTSALQRFVRHPGINLRSADVVARTVSDLKLTRPQDRADRARSG
jgi:hypothetical protein